MSSTAVPVYFEISWSILSSIGLFNILFGLLVVGITSLSTISIVPIIVSAACAIANGMCYYAFYADYPRIPTVVAGAFADVMWLIQEAGMSFYSYQILTRVLESRDRTVFLCLFWFMMLVILAIRVVILISRAMYNMNGTTDLQYRIDHLHVGYFVSIAVIEMLSSFYLLRIFGTAKATSTVVKSKNNLFHYLMRSTEIRLATLSLVGITRAITYSFQTAAQSATSVASQIDRFVYTLECVSPVLMMIDILGSKLMLANYVNKISSNSRLCRNAGTTHGIKFTTANDGTIYATNRKSASCIKSLNGGRSVGQGSMYPLSSLKTRVNAHGIQSSSEDRIIGAGPLEKDDNRNPFNEDLKLGGINKTVEFEFQETSVAGV